MEYSTALFIIACEAPNESAAAIILPASNAISTAKDDDLVLSNISIGVSEKCISLYVLVLSTVVRSIVSIRFESRDTIPICPLLSAIMTCEAKSVSRTNKVLPVTLLSEIFKPLESLDPKYSENPIPKLIKF